MNDDLISRQAAVDVLLKAYPLLNKEYLVQTMASVPSAQLERKNGKIGRWYKKETFNGHWKCCCSECDYNGRFEWIACPNCGAEMRGEQE